MAESDKYYIERCLDGHPDDFRHLVQRYQAVLLAYLAGKLGDKSAAEEAAQEALVRAYFGLGRLKRRQSFYPWLLGIAERVGKELLRDQRRCRQMPDSLSERASEAPRDYGLERAIAELPEAYRELILLRFYAGRSCSEVADQLNMPLGTVTKNLSRAYARLRQLLGQQKSENSEVQK